ncbi:MAG TPA: hypothetical protein VFN31_00460 [Candidatus Saccharimonadales bacterium]|nr:hypothetical protein [Candidatus Saccharimonadales bacterium]
MNKADLIAQKRRANQITQANNTKAAEVTEQIAQELANVRAREIGAEMQRIRERLTLEQEARIAAQKELLEGYEN